MTPPALLGSMTYLMIDSLIDNTPGNAAVRQGRRHSISLHINRTIS